MSSRIHTRHVIVLMAFLAHFMNYSMRVNISVALVAMVNHTALPDEVVNISECGNYTQEESLSVEDGPFLWNEAIQANILGALFLGYIFTNIPGGRLAEVIGAKLVMGIGLFLTGILTLLTPLAAKYSWKMLVLVRFIEGLCEGVTFPATSVLLSAWIPPLERTKMWGYVITGTNCGQVLTLSLTGWIAVTFGWEVVFYAIGTLTVIWYTLWLVFLYDTPQKHPRISNEEKQFIASAVGDSKSQHTNMKLPLRSMLTSPAVWGYFVFVIGMDWGSYTLMTELPSYLKHILKYNIASNGLHSALPYVFQWIVAIIVTNLADRMRQRGVSTTFVRKFCNAVGALSEAIGFVLLTFTGCDSTSSIVILYTSVAMSGFYFAGYNPNPLDLTPNFAGSLHGIGNTLGTIPGVVAPLFTGFITKGHQTQARWSVLFYTTAAFLIVSTMVFCIIGSGEEQSWNQPEHIQRGTRNEEEQRQLLDSEEEQHLD